MPDGDSTLLFRELPQNQRLSVAEKCSLRAYARALAIRVAKRRSFTCVIAADQELRSLNHSFLGHDYPTDVLSFPSGDPAGDIGEMIISIDRAEAQAAEFGHHRLDEIRILMLHGLLHLTGFDHENDCGEMAAAEQAWQEDFGLPVTLIHRAQLVRQPS